MLCSYHVKVQQTLLTAKSAQSHLAYTVASTVVQAGHSLANVYVKMMPTGNVRTYIATYVHTYKHMQLQLRIAIATYTYVHDYIACL